MLSARFSTIWSVNDLRADQQRRGGAPVTSRPGRGWSPFRVAIVRLFRRPRFDAIGPCLACTAPISGPPFVQVLRSADVPSLFHSACLDPGVVDAGMSDDWVSLDDGVPAGVATVVRQVGGASLRSDFGV